MLENSGLKHEGLNYDQFCLNQNIKQSIKLIWFTDYE